MSATATPGLFVPDIEAYAQKDPLLYEILTSIMLYLQNIPITAGSGAPQNSLAIADPPYVYFQKDATSGPGVLWFKDHNQHSPTDLPTTFKTGWAQFGKFGSISPSDSVGFGIVASANSITFYWDGTNGSTPITIYLPETRIIGPLSGHQAITGLAANTTYFFYPFFNERTSQIEFLTGPGTTGTPAFAFTAVGGPARGQQFTQPWYIPLATGAISVKTGTGAASGGGGAGFFRSTNKGAY